MPKPNMSSECQTLVDIRLDSNGILETRAGVGTLV